MGRPAVTAQEAQSFDRIADVYDRLGDLNDNELMGSWLDGLLPAAGWPAAGGPAAGGRALDLGCGAGRHAVLLAERFAHVDAIDLSGPMIDVARERRARPNISYRQADLHDVTAAGRYDFILSVMTLHHVADLDAALRHIKTLVAPGGRLVVVDAYPSERPPLVVLPLLERIVPVRGRLHGLAVLKLAFNLRQRGPVTAWEIYRLQVSRHWLDHRVSDRFFTRAELERSCQALFPGYRLDILGGPTGIGLVWDATAS